MPGVIASVRVAAAITMPWSSRSAYRSAGAAVVKRSWCCAEDRTGSALAARRAGGELWGPNIAATAALLTLGHGV